MSYVDYPSVDSYLLRIIIDCFITDEPDTHFEFEYGHYYSSWLGGQIKRSDVDLFASIYKCWKNTLLDKLSNAVKTHIESLSDKEKERLYGYLDCIKSRHGRATLLKLIITYNRLPDIVKQLYSNSPHIPKPINHRGDFTVGLETEVNALFKYEPSDTISESNVRFTEVLIECNEILEKAILDDFTRTCNYGYR